eukprot:11155400-Lingulodinium_polyedra.AAC.1
MHRLRHRISKADCIYYMHRGLLSTKGPIGPRLAAWSRSAATSATFGAENWRLNKEVLLTLQRWELGKLRKVFRMRADSSEEYYKTTTDKLRQWIRHWGGQMAHITALKAVYKQAWKMNKISVGKKDNPLWQVRNFRDKEWWDKVKYIDERKRKVMGWVHTHQGHTT